MVTDRKPDSRMVLTHDSNLSFDTEDPDLATGENGSGVFGTYWFVNGVQRGRGAFRGSFASLTGTTLRLTKDGAYRVVAVSEDNSYPGNRTGVNFSFTMDGLPPSFTVSKSQSNIGNTQATRVNVSVGGTISDANGIAEAELSLRSRVEGVCPTGAADSLNLAATRVTGNKRDLSSDGSTTITFDETFTVTAPSAGDITGAGEFVDENLCFFLRVEDVATDQDGDGPGNDATYDVGQFTVGWQNPGPVHRLGATNWDAAGDTAATTNTAATPLTVTEGDATGSEFALTLSSAISGPPMTVRFSAPPTVTINPPLSGSTTRTPGCRLRWS